MTIETGGTSTSLVGLKVFVVEDELLLTMLLEDILDDIGCSMAASAANIRQASDLLPDLTADIALLDVNLGGDPVFPIAERLAEKRIPIIFASGYGSATLPERWQNYPTLPKPFTSDQVAAMLANVWAQR